MVFLNKPLKIKLKKILCDICMLIRQIFVLYIVDKLQVYVVIIFKAIINLSNA
jgi:hypothetical protein